MSPYQDQIGQSREPPCAHQQIGDILDARRIDSESPAVESGGDSGGKSGASAARRGGDDDARGVTAVGGPHRVARGRGDRPGGERRLCFDQTGAADQRGVEADHAAQPIDDARIGLERVGLAGYSCDRHQQSPNCERHAGPPHRLVRSIRVTEQTARQIFGRTDTLRCALRR